LWYGQLNNVVVFKEVLQEGLDAGLVVRPTEVEEEYAYFSVGGGKGVGLKRFDEGNGFECFRHEEPPF
jgi:hypothetical protein